MVTSLLQSLKNGNIGFSVFDQISYFDDSLPFGNVLSADCVREMFADSGVLFGDGENDLWNTGLTLWSFIGQVLQDGKQRSCNAAVTHATRYMVEHGLEPCQTSSKEIHTDDQAEGSIQVSKKTNTAHLRGSEVTGKAK